MVSLETFPTKLPAIYDAIIIGAGFSGMYALHKLRNELGLNVRAFDAAGGVGGTWWYNRYPGARVDGPSSPFYSYMFSKEIADEWFWPETQADCATILSYLEFVAERLDLKKDIQFNTWVSNPHYDETKQLWTIKTNDGKEYSARFLICGVGILFVANLPDYRGINDFAGERYHTGSWPHEKISFVGKRVGVIGTGSSGIQCIPEIATEAAHVTVFQRTAQFSLPARNRPLTTEELNHSRENWKQYREIMCNNHGFPIASERRNARDFTLEERQKIYENLWAKGGFGLVLESFPGVMVNRDLNEEIGDFVKSKIEQIVEDPKVADKLKPKYLFGTKRLVLDNGYFETFNRGNVSLVDLTTDPIQEFTAKSVLTKNTEHPIDILVLATGFDAVTGSILKLNPKGTSGVTLEQEWKGRYETNLGITIPKFPNLFIIHGPGSPGVFFTVPLGSERTTDWIANCIQHMKDNGFGSIETTREAAENWGREIDEIASHTLFPETPSWYLGANIPGKPRQFLGHPNGTAYYERLEEVAKNGFKGFKFKKFSSSEDNVIE